MTQDLKYENDTLVTGQSIQSDAEVAGTSLLFTDSDVDEISLYITWSNQTSWQGCECYVIDPDGNYHYVFNAGSLPFGSGQRADVFVITAASGNFPYTQDGTWEFHLSDQMFNTCNIIQVRVTVKCTDANMPVTHNEISWYGGGWYRGGIDLSNNQNHVYPYNNATIVADTGSNGANAFSFSSASSQRWSDGSVADYNNEPEWSVSAWVKPDQTSAFKQMIFCNHGYVRGNFQLYQSGDEFGLFLGYYDPTYTSGDSETIATTNTNITTGNWYNVVATFDGNANPKLNLFVDGVAASVSRTTGGNGLTTMPYNSYAGTAPDQTIGAMKQANNSTIHYPLDGSVDACRTVNSVYTSEDISWLSSGRDGAGGPVVFKPYFIPQNQTAGMFQ
jgi:hypothetical protein